MSANEIIVLVMAAFMLLGALDRIFGNRFGLGAEFESGLMAMGSLALAMLGTLCLAPVLAQVLRPVIVPVFQWVGADPAIFAGMILANDMGGAALAQQLCLTPEAGIFAGLIVASMFGPTIVFTIPVALGIIHSEDRPYLARGVLAGIITIPIGAFVGGLTAGFPVTMVLRNLIPIVIIALLLAIGLWRAEERMIKGFTIFGKGVVIVITIGLAAAVFEALTGFTLIPGLQPIEEGFQIVGEIAIILAGAFPLIFVLTKLLRKPLQKAGTLMGVNEHAAAGLLASLANSIPMLGMMKDMDPRGKVINVAFAVSAAFVFGDHLGFTAGFAPEYLISVIAGKLVGGVSAAALALFFTRRENSAS